MNLARGREYSAMERSIDCRFRVCAAWWKKIRRIRVTLDRLGSGLRLCTGRF